MKLLRVMGIAVLGATLGFAGPAMAKECLSEPVVTKGKMKFAKVQAYPSSLWAWRKKVRNTHGPAYQAWRRAEGRNIECSQVYNDRGKKRWQCTRTARPCAKNGKGNGQHNHYDAKYDAPEYPGFVLKKGNSGDDVEVLQRLLGEAGYTTEVDGDFGYKTRSAVMAFQRAEAIQVDGIVGRETWERLAG